MKILITITLTLFLHQCSVPAPPIPPPTPTRLHDTAVSGPGPIISDAPCKSEMWTRTYGAMKRFGDEPAQGADPYVRSKMHHRCVTVRGTVRKINPPCSPGGATPCRGELDGDIKMKIAVDPLTYILKYYSENELVNSHNWNAAKKEYWLTVELVCAAPSQVRPAGSGVHPVTGQRANYEYPGERSPVRDHFCKECVEACRGYRYTGYMPKLGDRIDVTGELITDTGAGGNPPRPMHGGREIHPVTLIKRAPSW